MAVRYVIHRRLTWPQPVGPDDLLTKLTAQACACGSSGAAACGAGGVMAWERGRGKGARGRGGRWCRL